MGRALLDGTVQSTGRYDDNWMDRSEPKAWNQMPSDPISTKSVGKYKDVLSREELDMLCRIQLRPWVETRADLPRSFGHLLDCLSYDQGNRNDGVRPLGFSRASIQAADYWRRWKRFQYRRSWQLPCRYTELA